MSAKRRSYYGDAQIEAYFGTRLVPDKGYCWLDMVEPAVPMPLGPMLQGKSPFLAINPEGKFARRYEPLKEYPLLYREFAALELTREGILRFANVYGWLGIGEYVTENPPSAAPRPRPKIMIQAEGMNLWIKEIQEMNFLVRLWDLRASANPDELSKFLVWNKDIGAVSIQGGVANQRLLNSRDPIVLTHVEAAQKPEDYPVTLWYEIIADSMNIHRGLYQTWRFGEPTVPIGFYIGQRVNARLEKHVSPRILLGPNNNLIGKVVPQNLLGALWLQFYQTVTGQQKIIKCAVCQKDLDVTESRNTKRMHDQCARREQMRRYHEKRKSRAM